MAYCHFELCRDCELGCFSELLLGDIWRWCSCIKKHNKTQQHHFWNYILVAQCKLYARSSGGGGSQQREVADVVFTDTSGELTKRRNVQLPAVRIY